MSYDDLGRKIVLPEVPGRIVVLTGSLFDEIFELGAGDKIVGVIDNIERSYAETCERYPALLQKKRVGRWNAPNMEKIVEIDPDLVIVHASKENPDKNTAIFEMRGIPYAGFTTVENLTFGLERIKRLGGLLGKQKEAEELTLRLKQEIDELAMAIASGIETRPLVYYWWGTGDGTYGRKAAIHELIEMAGGINLTGEFDRAYMEISSEYVISRDPDVIIISYWQEKQKDERLRAIYRRPGFDRIKAIKNNRVYIIDGHDFHTPLKFAALLRQLVHFFHPALFSDQN